MSEVKLKNSGGRQYLWVIFLLLMLSGRVALSVCVKVNKADLRVGPGPDKGVSWQVGRYMPFKVKKEQDNWMQVTDLDGDTHWIFSPLVTTDYLCAVVKVKRVSLRTGPGNRFPKHPKYPFADKFEAFKVLKQKKDWILVTDDYGDKLWLSRKSVWMP